MNTKKIISIACACLTCGLGAAGLSAQPAEDALAIVRAVDAKMHSDTARQEMTMTTYPDARDDKNKREFTIKSYSKGDDDSYMEFLEPRSIRGLRILGKGDDNWVFFPSTGRTRKIAGKSKKDSVQGVGGDFSYEDIGGGTYESKYSFRLTGSDEKTWTLEGAPKKADAVYSKVVLVVDKATSLPARAEFSSKEDGHYKDLVFSDVKVLGGRETSTRMTMTNLKKGSKTAVLIRAADFDVSVDERYFNPSRFDK
jgi:outer membrane lipoprotein-sorting protein